MILDISVAVIAGFVVIFVLFLIPALLQIRSAAKEAEKFIDTVRQQVVPISHDVVHILSDVRGLIKSAEREMVKVEESVEAVRDTARRIREFEGVFRERVEQPLLELAAVVSALVKGTRAFIQYMRKK